MERFYMKREKGHKYDIQCYMHSIGIDRYADHNCTGMVPTLTAESTIFEQEFIQQGDAIRREAVAMVK